LDITKRMRRKPIGDNDKFHRIVRDFGTGLVITSVILGIGYSFTNLTKYHLPPERHNIYIKPSGLNLAIEEKSEIETEIKNCSEMPDLGYGIERMRINYWKHMAKLMEAKQNGNKEEIKIRTEICDMLMNAIKKMEN